ncbi:MAG: N-formylglutamate amidohydrolase [Rhodospirillales bacterium]|nr:N-formylglutamate amidohydrolase [Rhodospirillales bacterium]MDE2197642.1 N-formylglutamate amidohydrolase [Rhodospirillales bacterium]
MADPTLLDDDEPSPVRMAHARGASPFFITCDHAGRRVPRRLGDLGVAAADMDRHIAWDPGAWPVALHLGQALDAFTIGQEYSRLVIDSNRAPGVASSIPEISESTPIPGNIGLDAAARAAREGAILRPYHDAIGAALDARAGRATVLVAMHSFTPVFKGVARPWHAGVLFNRNPRFARLVLALLREEPGLVVGENEPYAVSDLTDYTVPLHAERRGLPYVELEIRQDLIADAAGQRAWADRFIRILPAAWQAFQAAA